MIRVIDRVTIRITPLTITNNNNNKIKNIFNIQCSSVLTHAGFVNKRKPKRIEFSIF